MPAMTDLSLKQLTLKLVTLLALTTTQRCQTLAYLDTRFMQETPSMLRFTIQEKLKTSRPGKHLDPIEVKPYHADVSVCPVTHIKHYLTKTESLRQGTKLFISLTKPFRSVTAATIGRWIKSMLTEAGIDTSQFSAHSSRSASSSYALSTGLPVQDILKAGGWSRAETFAKHYNKPIKNNLGNLMLESALATANGN